MARKTIGRIIETRTQKGAMYALRFQANGKRHFVTLGASSEGWDRRQAEAALRHTLADVERGTWQPPRREPVPDADRDPTFHLFASEWYDQRKAGWRPKTRRDYEWKLARHLLPTFGHYRLSQIRPADVDRFRDARLGQGVLSPGQVNKAIGLLAQILEVAVEYEYIERNPAKGRSRRAKVTKRAPVWLDSAEHIAALLDAAGELDREARADRQVPRRAILATLTFTGLRIGELRELRWRNVDLAAGWITVTAQSKTEAGQRRIRLLPVLRDELATLKATARASADERVFPTQ
jgi:integrase